MFQSIWQDIQQQFRFGNKVTQLIIINVAVFVLFGFMKLIGMGFEGSTFVSSVESFFSFSKDWMHNLTHPWTLITYAFMHGGLWHLFWNMILFYWFGRILGDLIGDKYILPLYFLGAIAGGLLFWLTAGLGLYDSGLYIVGASASVMAFIVAAAFTAPDYMIRLLLLGNVKLKYLALAIVVIDILAVGSDANTGGHMAHIGGMLMGYFFVSSLQNGYDMAAPLNRLFDSVSRFFEGFGQKPGKRSSGKTAQRPSYAYKSGTAARAQSRQQESTAAPEPDLHQERLDLILDKIKAKGMESLSEEDRDFLSKVSRR